MELVEGQSLRQRLAADRCRSKRALAIGMQVA